MKKSIKILLISVCVFFAGLLSSSAKETTIQKYCSNNIGQGITSNSIGYMSSEKGDATVSAFSRSDENGNVKCIRVSVSVKADNTKKKGQRYMWVTLDLLDSIKTNSDGYKKITKEICNDNKDDCVIGTSFSYLEITDTAIKEIKDGNGIQFQTFNNKSIEYKNATLYGLDEKIEYRSGRGQIQDKDSNVPGKDDKKNYYTGEKYNTDASYQLDSASCDSLLGTIDDTDDPAYYIHQGFIWIKYIAIIILVALSMKDFFMAIVDKDEDSINKATKKCVKRLIYAVIIFLLPIIIEQVMGWSNLIDDPSICGLK